MAESSEAIDVLRQQLREREGQANQAQQRFDNIRSKYGQVKEKHDKLQAEYVELKAAYEELSSAIPDLEYLSKTIEEWTPIVDAAEAFEEERNQAVAERDQLVEALNSMTEEYTSLRSLYDEVSSQSALPPDEANAKIRELQGEIDRANHERAFYSAIGEFKDESNQPIALNDGVDMNDVWSRIGYVPEGQPPEATKALEQLRQARERARFLFAPAHTGNNGSPRTAPAILPREPVPPGPGASRGTAPHSSGVLNVGQIANKSGVISTSESIALAEAVSGRSLRHAPVQPPSQPGKR